MNKKFVFSLLFYLVSAFGIALTIEANIGLTSFNAFGVALSEVSQIKIGTITTVINCTFLLTCWFLDQHRSVKSYVLMLIALVSFGYVINLILYSVFGQVTLVNYPVRVAVYILGTVITGFGIGRILHFGFLKFPVENFCALMSLRTHYTFRFYRYAIDVVCVVGSLSLSFFFDLPIFVREGTLIGLFLFAPIISWSRNLTF